MNPSFKENLAAIVMAILLPLLGFVLVGVITGCSSVKKPINDKYAASHYAIDAAMSDVKISQQKAASQVYSIKRSVADPIVKAQVDELQKTISEMGLNLETATGKISWYKSEYEIVLKQNDLIKKQSDKNSELRIQSEKERDSLIWIFSVGCGVLSVAAFRPVLSAINGWKQIIFIAGTFVAGFSLGFSIGRWSLRLLSQFTPHLPF
jgi:hypothetical protein